MYLGLIGAVALVSQSNPVIRNYDPPAADSWNQSIEFGCNGNAVRISGFGAARPLDRPVTITFNGRPLRGKGLRSLKVDLSDRRAAYRIGARCNKRTGGFAVFINKGVKSESGAVEFWSARASIRNGSLTEYTGPQEADANSFWFR